MEQTAITPPKDALTAPGHARAVLALRIALTLLAMFAPLIVAYVITYQQGYDLFRAVPMWNDERWWYAQYAAMSEYGRPLGYFGYDGNHAKVGTFGPWGVFPTLIIGGLARVFGWGLHAFVYYNFALLAAATLIFILLARPNVRSLILLTVTNCLQYMALCYGMICMNEIVRYSVAIVLAGIVYRIIVQPKVSRARFILRLTLVPLLLAYSVCFYRILAAFIPLYVYAMFRSWKPWVGLAAAVPVTAVAVKVLARINGVTCAPYTAGAEAPDYSAALALNPSLQLAARFQNFLSDIRNLDPISLLSDGIDSPRQAFLFWFCILLYVSMGVLLWRMHVSIKKQDKTSFVVEGACLFLLGCFWGGHLLLYTTYDWTFLRGCYSGAIAAMFLAAMLPREEGHAWRAMFITCLAGAVTFLSVFSGTFSTSDRFSTPAQDEQWAERRAALEDVIVLDPDAEDPWDNTVKLSHVQLGDYYVMPYGVGLNTGWDEPKYLVLGYEFDDEAEREPTIQGLLDDGRQIIYEDEHLTVLAWP